jgi:hypothetical protein
MKGFEGGSKLSQNRWSVVTRTLPPPPNIKKVFLQIKPRILILMVY